MDGNELGGPPITRMHIPAGYCLMLGDDRVHSEDCRACGLEPRGGVIGTARLRYWPLSGIGTP
jgi:Signal peptidase, peptidase S26